MSSCPRCGTQMNFVQQYSQWYCSRCQQYQQPAAPQHAPQPQQYGAQPPQQHPPQFSNHHQGQHQPQPVGYQAHQAATQPSAAHYQQPVPSQPAQNYAAQPAPQPYQPQGGYQQPPAGPQQPQQTHPQYAQQLGGQYPAQQYPQAQPPQGRLDNEISQGPSFSVIVFHMKPGQSVVAEAGAMMFMHNTLDIDTHGRKGGILKGLATSAFGGESFFVNTFTAARGPGDLALVGPVMGDIKPIELHQGMILQSGAYLASDPSVGLDTKWQGLKGFLTDRDFIMLHATGPGTAWVASFGAIIERDLRPGEVLSVDTGHIVAFPDTMQFSVRRIGNWKSTILSGEGLATDFQGPGKILMQTRHLPAFAEQLIPYLPNQR